MPTPNPLLTRLYAEACYMEAIGENLIGNLADDELARVEIQYLTLQRQANQQLRAMAAIEASKIKSGLPTPHELIAPTTTAKGPLSCLPKRIYQPDYSTKPTGYQMINQHPKHSGKARNL